MEEFGLNLPFSTPMEMSVLVDTFLLQSYLTPSPVGFLLTFIWVGMDAHIECH